jgi:hypothetical protein
MSKSNNELVFKDISDEMVREYPTVGLSIEKPLKLHISKSGGHRIIASDGWCYYVQPSVKNGFYFRFKSESGGWLF